MTSDAQTKMADELKNTRDQISQIQRQLGEVQQAGKQMSQTAQTLEGIWAAPSRAAPWAK